MKTTIWYVAFSPVGDGGQSNILEAADQAIFFSRKDAELFAEELTKNFNERFSVVEAIVENAE